MECFPSTVLDLNWVCRTLKRDYEKDGCPTGSFYHNIAYIKKNHRYLYIIKFAEKRVGCVLMTLGCDSPWWPTTISSSSIDILWVANKHRGKGIGKAVVEWHIQRQIGQGITMDQVTAISSAISFWEACGYKEVSNVMRRNLLPTPLKRIRIAFTDDAPSPGSVLEFLRACPDPFFNQVSVTALGAMSFDGGKSRITCEGTWKLYNITLEKYIVLKGYAAMAGMNLVVELIDFM